MLLNFIRSNIYYFHLLYFIYDYNIINNIFIIYLIDYRTLASFDKNNNKIGFPKFIKKSNLYNSKKPLIEDNKVIINAIIHVYNDENQSIFFL